MRGTNWGEPEPQWILSMKHLRCSWSAVNTEYTTVKVDSSSTEVILHSPKKKIKAVY